MRRRKDLKSFVDEGPKAYSDLTGFRFPLSEMKNWFNGERNLIVHESEWEPEHPQRHIRPRIENLFVPNARPEAPLTFDADATFSETSLAGLTLFLDASVDGSITKDSDDKVSGWTDQSGNGFNYVQADTGKQPTFIATGMNRHETLLFTAGDLLDTTSDFMTKSSYTIFIVAKFNPFTAEVCSVQGTAASLGVTLSTAATAVLAISTGGILTTVSNDPVKTKQGVIISIVIDATAQRLTLTTQGVEDTGTNGLYAGGTFDGNNTLRIGDGYNGGIPGLTGNISSFFSL